MNTITLNKEKFYEIISQKEFERNEKNKISAEWIELDDKIQAILEVVYKCEIRTINKPD